MSKKSMEKQEQILQKKQIQKSAHNLSNPGLFN